jgi:TPR repeat protein
MWDGASMIVSAAPESNTPANTDAVEHKATMRARIDAMPISGISLEPYLDPNVLAWGERPTVGTIYSLQFLRVVQKVENGYLMRFESPFGDSAAVELALLKTTADLPESFQFTDMGHFAVYSGPFQYQAVNGFTRSIYRFDMLPDEANGWVLERLGQRASAKPLQAERHATAEELRKAAESGDAKAQMKLAVAYAADPDRNNQAEEQMRVDGIPSDKVEALRWYRKAAENGYGPAQIVMGDFCSFGDGVPMDFKQSLAWYRRAQARNTPNAKERIGGLLAILDSPARSDADKMAVHKAFADEIQTTKDLTKAAIGGDTIAARRAGERLWDGIGAEQDHNQGLRFLRFAAEHGDCEAQVFTGSVYFTGNGVAQDFTEGVKWLRRAADQSDAVAQFNLALAYFRGEGVQKDEVEALKLLKLSADNGNAEARRILAKNR